MNIQLGTNLNPAEKAALVYILTNSTDARVDNDEAYIIPNPQEDEQPTLTVQLSHPLFRRQSACHDHPERVYFEVFDDNPIALGNIATETKILKRLCAYRIDIIDGQAQLVVKSTQSPDKNKQIYVGKMLTVPKEYAKPIQEQLHTESKIYTYTYQKHRQQSKNVTQFQLPNNLVGLVTLVPYLDGIDLFQYVEQLHAHVILNRGTMNPQNDLGIGKILVIAIRGALALHEFHNSEIKLVHRDVKLENLIINEKLEIKIADFGLTTSLKNANLVTGVGSKDYLAPEMEQRNQYPITQQVDAYSYGITLQNIFMYMFPILDKNATLSFLYTGIIDLLRRSYSVDANDSLFKDLNVAVAFKVLIDQAIWMQEELLIEDPEIRWTVETFAMNLADLSESFIRSAYPGYLEALGKRVAGYRPPPETARTAQGPALQKSAEMIEAFKTSWNDYIKTNPPIEHALLAMDLHLHNLIMNLKVLAPVVKHRVRLKKIEADEPAINKENATTVLSPVRPSFNSPVKVKRPFFASNNNTTVSDTTDNATVMMSPKRRAVIPETQEPQLQLDTAVLGCS